MTTQVTTRHTDARFQHSSIVFLCSHQIRLCSRRVVLSDFHAVTTAKYIIRLALTPRRSGAENLLREIESFLVVRVVRCSTHRTHAHASALDVRSNASLLTVFCALHSAVFRYALSAMRIACSVERHRRLRAERILRRGI